MTAPATNARRITAATLRAKHACTSEVRKFARLFPNGSNGSLRDCLKAANANLDFYWAAEYLLSAPARDAYLKATVPARDAYEKATAPARDAYVKATALALDAYLKATALALDAYEKATALALAAAFKMDRRMP